MRLIVLLLCVMGMIFGVSEDSKSEYSKSATKKTSESWRNVRSLKANFVQEIKGERGAKSVMYNGKVYAAYDKVKWEYTKPLKKEVYLEQHSAYVYEPDIKQVTIGTLEANVDFIHILKQVQKVDANNYKTKIGQTTYYVVIKDSKPYSLMYKDSLENTITIIFSNVEMDAKIDANIFNFNPPSDVDYIDAG